MWETSSSPFPSNTQPTRIPTSNGRSSAGVNMRGKTKPSVNLATLALISPCAARFKNGQPLKEDYRIRQKNDALVIHGVAETDAGNYTIFLSNRVTKEEQKRSFQLLVNGNPSFSFVFISLSCFFFKVDQCCTMNLDRQFRHKNDRVKTICVRWSPFLSFT